MGINELRSRADLYAEIVRALKESEATTGTPWDDESKARIYALGVAKNLTPAIMDYFTTGDTDALHSSVSELQKLSRELVEQAAEMCADTAYATALVDLANTLDAAIEPLVLLSISKD